MFHCNSGSITVKGAWVIHARMAKLADAHDLRSCELLFMRVQVPLCALSLLLRSSTQVWLKRTVLKTVRSVKRRVGSNPTCSFPVFGQDQLRLEAYRVVECLFCYMDYLQFLLFLAHESSTLSCVICVAFVSVAQTPNLTFWRLVSSLLIHHSSVGRAHDC